MNQHWLIRKNWKIVVFVFVTAMVMMACGSSPDPTATVSVPTQQPATQEPIIQPTETRESFSFGDPDPTDQSVDDPVDEPSDSDYPAFYVEEWDTDSDAWFTTAEINGNHNAKVSEAEIYTDKGKLVFELGKWLIGYVFYEPYTYEDVRLDVEVDNRGANTNNVLLVCRSSDEGQYMVSVTNGGLYTFYAYETAGENFNRMANGGSTLIKTGKDINTYTLICDGRDLTLAINGVEVNTYTDNKYVFRDGLVGIGVASNEVQPIKLEIDYVRISEP